MSSQRAIENARSAAPITVIPVKRLVWCREYDAIADEKRINEWWRACKLKIIDEFNPRWCDFFTQVAR
jgi:hypothetical protein